MMYIQNITFQVIEDYITYGVNILVEVSFYISYMWVGIDGSSNNSCPWPNDVMTLY